MGFGSTGGEGRWLAGGAGFAGGDDEDCWWQLLYGTVAKVTPRRIALFFSTLSAMTTRCRLHDRRRQV